jgi:hypothetical protein
VNKFSLHISRRRLRIHRGYLSLMWDDHFADRSAWLGVNAAARLML